MRNNQPVTGKEHPLAPSQSLISRTDTKGKITYVNQAFIDMCGFSEEELIGAPHNIIRHPDMPPEAFADLWSTLKRGDSWTGMVKNRQKNGDHYWVMANATPIFEDGKVIGYSSVRTAPARQQIEAAEKIYAKFREQRAHGLKIKDGKAIRSGWLGKLAGLKELNIHGKLNAVILLLCLGILAIGLFGLSGIQESNRQLTSVYENRAIPLGQLDTIVRLLNQNRMNISTAVIRQDPASSKALATEIEENLLRVNTTWQSYAATPLPSDEKALADRFASSRAAFLQNGLLPAVAALKSGDLAEARRLELEVLPALFMPVRDGVNALIKFQLDVAHAQVDRARTNYVTQRYAMLLAIVLGSMISLMLARYLARSIVFPLNDAVNFAKQIAAGNLTANIAAVKSGDEVGQLMHTLEVMKKSLSNIVAEVHEHAESIGKASGEIASGNTNLSQRTEEQAASLEETASSMEELTATVKHNAENSTNAKLMAHSASDTAAKGGEAMDQVVSTMDMIAASSRKITDIIAVIDSIAFQTNILALNAAVEAVRAGEQGRGFAVVAAEVRNLAQRSATAAKEIKELISEAVTKVEGGSIHVTQARDTMDKAVDAIRKVTDIMNEITAASAEQSSGIDQVCQAIMQMDQVTQQNAALVEEAAASSDSMQRMSAALVKNVGVFKVSLDHKMTSIV